MAVFIILAGIISVFAIGLGWYVGLAMIVDLVDLPQWKSASPEALVTRDQTLAMIYFFPVIMLGWIAIWGFMRASKSSVNFD